MRSLGRKSRQSGRQRRQADPQALAEFTYHSRQESIDERRLTQVPARSWLRSLLQRAALLLVLLLVVAVTVNLLSLVPQATIKSPGGSNGLFLHDDATYQAAVDRLLASSIWNRNKITINTGNLSAQMTKQFPELSVVTITVPLVGHRPVVNLQASHPALLLNTTHGAFVVDASGRALLQADDIPQNAQQSLLHVADQSGLSVRQGQSALSSDNVAFIQMVAAQLSAQHVSIASMTLPAASSELDVYLSGQPFFIKFNLQLNDAQQQAGTFLATLAQLQQQHVTPAHYIDVRVDGRAYYQ